MSLVVLSLILAYALVLSLVVFHGLQGLHRGICTCGLCLSLPRFQPWENRAWWWSRFKEPKKATYSIGDYVEAMALLDKFVNSKTTGDGPGPRLKDAAGLAASFAWDRFRKYQDSNSIEDAIRRIRAFLIIPSIDDFNRRSCTKMLADLIDMRSSTTGATENLQEANSRRGHGEVRSQAVPSYSCLVASLLDRSADKTHWWMEREEEKEHLRALDSVCRTTDIAEIGEAIKYCRLLLASCHSGDPRQIYPARALGEVLFHAFNCTNKIEYLHESVVAYCEVLKMPISQWAHFLVIQRLLRALSFRESPSRDQNDLDELMQLYSVACRNTHASARERYKMSCQWAHNARCNGHHTTSTAYEVALSLMEETLLFTPTLETPHYNLISLRDNYEGLPMDIASYELGRGRLNEAIQALERGRDLIWSELRGLRTLVDKLAVNTHLAEEFTMVNRALEALTMSAASESGMVTNEEEGPEWCEGMNKFGGLVMQHEKLLEKRKVLVSQIRALPGLEGFLKTSSFDTLRSAAARGPIIIVNHSRWRCDILIILTTQH